MPVVPDKKVEQIEFAEQHAPVWAATPTAIGLTAAQCTAITTATTTARRSYKEALAAREASKAATTQADNDIKTMLNLVGDAVKIIRSSAERKNNPPDFAAAQTPPAAAPVPAMPPTQPVEMRAVINSMGTLSVEWKASPATAGFDDSTSGVLYLVRRKMNAETGFTIVGTAKPTHAGKRGFSSFTDSSLPANPANLQYVVQGVRGNLNGPASNVFNVTLGIGGGGGMFVADSSMGPDLKMAA